MPREKGDEAFLVNNDTRMMMNYRLVLTQVATRMSRERKDPKSILMETHSVMALAEGSDDAGLVAVDDIPNGLIKYDGLGAEIEQSNEEWGGIGGGDKRKRKDKSQARCKKRKTLPTFVTHEYAKMTEGPEDRI
ncbi:hypothetical protein HD554DRAFT_2170708 [Boletus coccyginus]|nr:hypothetical protein HD554DRAFT_2170708 [Boletus coccyginus]